MDSVGSCVCDSRRHGLHHACGHKQPNKRAGTIASAAGKVASATGGKPARHHKRPNKRAGKIASATDGKHTDPAAVA